MTAPTETPRFEIRPPDGPERGVRVGCPEHDAWTEAEPGHRAVTFACEDCGVEVEASLHDLHDWRDWGEMC